MNAITGLFGNPERGRRSRNVGTIPPSTIDASVEATRGYSWSRIQNANRTARLGFLVGAAGAIVGCVGLAGIILTLPLKHDVNHWIIANPQTGAAYELPNFVDAVKRAPHAFDLYFAQKYVEARESWYQDEEKERRNIVAWSTDKKAMDDYTWATSGKNPDSPVATIGARGYISVDVIWSDESVDKDTGRITSKIRFLKTEQLYGQAPAKPKPMYVEFIWEKRPQAVPAYATKFNPLGMIVTHYTVGPDAAVGVGR